jgi:hypothetical protein
LFFSVDEFAVGGPIGPPNVTSEGALGTTEASADVFSYLGPVTPTAPGPVFGNLDVIDGDGVAPFGGPGTGLVEPNPFDAVVPDPGDNLDAVDVDTTLNDVGGFVFFSLDADFPDPFEPGAGGLVNSATAAANGFSSADVLVSFAGGTPSLYAPAPALGLDITGAFDDLDALALLDDGALDGVTGLPFFDPSVDSILFSVRRGSPVIGMLDSAFGAPILEGDVLTIPSGPSGLPSIFIAAEALGLTTSRADQRSDELDALDVVPEPSSLALVMIGLVSLAAYRWRRRRAR